MKRTVSLVLASLSLCFGFTGVSACGGDDSSGGSGGSKLKDGGGGTSAAGGSGGSGASGGSGGTSASGGGGTSGGGSGATGGTAGTGGSAGGAAYTTRLVHMADADTSAIDFCIKLTSDASYTGTPVLAAQGLTTGVPQFNVSAPVTVPTANGTLNGTNIKVIKAGSDCGSAELTELIISAIGPKSRLLYTKSVFAGAVGGSDNDSEQPTAGKDTVFQQPLPAPRTITYELDQDAGITTFNGFGNPSVLDVGTQGKLVSKREGGPTLERPFKPLAGGLAIIYSPDETNLIVCDELAPPVAGLMDCSANVRKP